MDQELINKVETLKLILATHATGGRASDLEYVECRRELIISSRIAKHLPKLVRVCRNLTEFWGFIQPMFARYTERREYLRKEFEPLLALLEADTGVPVDGPVTAVVTSVDSTYIQEAWQKALERRTSDPEGAITAARTLLESTCKHILDEEGETYDDSADLPKLFKMTAKCLKLSPDQHTEPLFKQILGGCQSVVEGLGALRNKHSDAHGRGALSVRPARRHADLAVNLAGAMAIFLLQTFEANKKKK